MRHGLRPCAPPVSPSGKPWWLLLRPERVQARAALAQAYCDPTTHRVWRGFQQPGSAGIFAREDIRTRRGRHRVWSRAPCAHLGQVAAPDLACARSHQLSMLQNLEPAPKNARGQRPFPTTPRSQAASPCNHTFSLLAVSSRFRFRFRQGTNTVP